MSLPTVHLSPAELRQVEDRVDNFRQAVKEHRLTSPLALTPDEMNGLIVSDQDLESLKGKLYVSITNNVLSAQMSVPMEDAGLPLFKGRYLNGTGTFAVSLKSGVLRIVAETFFAKGRPLPEVYMQQVRKQNLARNLNSNPRVSVALDSLQAIDVKDGKLLIVPK